MRVAQRWEKVTKRRKGQKRKGKKLELSKGLRRLLPRPFGSIVQLPEEERERDTAAIERAVAKKFKQLRGRMGNLISERHGLASECVP